METLPIVQAFFGKPVRFFKAEFFITMGCRYDTPSPSQRVAMHCRNDNASGSVSVLETWAVPLPDYARAIGYAVDGVWRIIKRNREVFEGFYRTEAVVDTLGRLQPTVVMALEMCDGLNMKLHAARIKDPRVRAWVVAFQRWVILTFGLIRTGRLRPARWARNENTPTEYLNILSLPPGSATRSAVAALAATEGKSQQQIYRRLQVIRGGNAITRAKTHKKTRVDAGTHKYFADYDLVMGYLASHPTAHGREIKNVLGLSVSVSRINVWVRNRHEI